MHLAGKAERANGCRLDAAGGERGARGFMRGPPPVVGILLGPRRARGSERRVVARSRGQQCAVFSDDDGARAAGADVDAEDRNRGLR
jgi:hypothetical protein